MGKDQHTGVRALIYLSSIYGPALIGFSVIVLVRGCKSRHSISGDCQNTTCDTDAGGRGGQRGKRRPRFMFARKNMTLGLSCLSAQHLLHYRQDSYALFFCRGSLRQKPTQFWYVPHFFQQGIAAYQTFVKCHNNRRRSLPCTDGPQMRKKTHFHAALEHCSLC